MAVFLNAEATKLQKKSAVVEHSIQSGDTLLSLAQQYHSTVLEIKAKNHLEENEILKLERVLKIPTNTYVPKKKKVITLAKNAKSKHSNAKLVVHTIGDGETLFTVAKKYHSTSKEIQKENGLEKDQMLKIGQMIVVPIDIYFPNKKKVMTLAKDAKSKHSNAKLVVHTIGDGETLFTVAKKYHSTSKEIQKENGLEKDQMLNIGQMIVVPINTYFPKKDKVATVTKKTKSKYSNAKLIAHTIGEGETLFTIAKKYHSTSKEIQKENGLEKDQMLNIGQMIVVPMDTYFPTKKEVITLAKNAKSKYSNAKLVTHTIEDGETLFTIARKHHTTMDEVAKENSLKEGEVLKLGRVLIVPTNTYSRINKKSLIVKKSSKSNPKKIKLVKHSIKDGETLFIIARKHHTTIAEIQKENALKKGEVLKLGRILIVPKDTYSPKKIASIKKAKQKPKLKIVKHKIKAGETLFTIARKHKTTISAVRKKNNLKQGAVLKLGYILKVPSNTYKVPKIRIAKKTHTKRKTNNKITKRKTTKRKVTSLAKIDKIIVKKNNIIIHKRKNSYRSRQSKITSIAKKKLGRRYVWGASGTKNTYDCSSFTKYVYRKNGITIPRTSINQSKFGKHIKRNNLKKGDLIFFDTSKRHKGYVNHVGIYLGNGRFIHASSAKKKVVISNLSRFYGKRYRGARRPS